MAEMMNFQGPGFHMQVPTDWLITSNPEVQAMFVAPPQAGMRANLMITLRPLEASATLDAILSSALEIQKKDYPEFTLLEQGQFSIGDVIGHQHFYKWYNEKHTASVVQRQVLIVLNQVLTTITTTRMDVESVEDVDQAFAAILSSFKFDS